MIWARSHNDLQITVIFCEHLRLTFNLRVSLFVCYGFRYILGREGLWSQPAVVVHPVPRGIAHIKVRVNIPYGGNSVVVSTSVIGPKGDWTEPRLMF